MIIRHRSLMMLRMMMMMATNSPFTLIFLETSREFQELITRTGADIAFDDNPSPVPGMKIIIIRGVPSQIEAAVKIICQITGDEVCVVTTIKHYKA